MARKITVVISQGQSANPAKRKLEEDLVAGLLFERGLEVAVIPNLYDLAPDGTGMLCLQGISGDLIVMSWLYPRAAHWILDRNGIRGQEGQSLLKLAAEDDDDDEEDEDEAAAAEEAAKATAPRAPVPNRKIYCIDLRARDTAEPFLKEVQRIVAENSVQTVGLMGWINGNPNPAQLDRYLSNGNGNGNSAGASGVLPILGEVKAAPPAAAPEPVPTSESAEISAAASPAEPLRIVEEGPRRWYPVIDYSRCTNCLECLDFCLFGVYGVGTLENILVEQPDNCRKGCPACSRVCPENAIIFPQHKTPAIAGSPDGTAGGLKIDLSILFGAPNALEQAVLERDVELVDAGRGAVGMSVGIPRRQAGKSDQPKDDLDSLMDELDDLGL